MLTQLLDSSYSNLLHFEKFKAYVILHQTKARVARCLVFNRTVWYFDSLSSIKMTVIPDNPWVNSSIFRVTDTGTSQCSVF